MIPIPEIAQIYFFCSAVLFTCGFVIVVTRKNPIFVLIGIELMLNAANLNLISWSSMYSIQGQALSLFIIVLAVCETSLALAIIYQLVSKTGRTQMSDLKI